MANNGLSTSVEWMWKTNFQPFESVEPDTWDSYSEECSAIIEEAYKDGERFAHLTNYTIDLEKCVQISNKDDYKRRPVKRKEYSKESWVQLRKILGKGGFGTVYKGIYRGSQEVACKVTESQLSSDAMRETNILKTLCHPNIVRYIDVIHAPQHTLLVMELIDGGAIYEYIRKTPRSSNYWSICQKMMIDVAYAMTYLHEKPIVHADLKSDNILMRSNGTAILSDFGLSKIIEDSTTRQSYKGRMYKYERSMFTLILGAVRWLSPELCSSTRERCSFQSDVWAYGCVLLEIITKKLPWEELYKSNDELTSALSDERNDRVFHEFCHNQKATESFRKNLRACCVWQKKNRPNFAKIIKDFHETPSNEDRVQNDGNFTPSGTKMPYYQQQTSAPSCPPAFFGDNNRQKQIQRSSSALYDPGYCKNDELNSSPSPSAARLKYAGHTPCLRNQPKPTHSSHRKSDSDFSD